MLDIDMMRESRLTSVQRNGLQSILRKGQPLPTRPSDIYRQELFRHRHAERARRMGLPVLAPMFQQPNFSHDAQMYMKVYAL